MKIYMAVCVALLGLAAAAPAGEKKTASRPVNQLVKALSDKDADVRAVAAEELGKQGAAAKKAAADLVKALKDEDDDVRDAVADALGRIGADAKTVVPGLIAALTDKSGNVRASAANAIGLVGEAALKDLKEGRQAKAVALKLVGPGSAATSLLVCLKDPEEDVREAAIGALFALSSSPLTTDAVPALIEALADKKYKTVREMAAECLCEMGPDAKKAVPALIDALSTDSDKNVRVSAVEALGLIEDKSKNVVSALAKATEDKSTVVRCAAAQSLGQLAAHADIALPVLLKLIENDGEAKGSAHIRHNAIEAVGSFGPAASAKTAKVAVPALRSMLNTKGSPKLRACAAEALGQFGSHAKAAIPDLEKASKGTGDLAKAATNALKLIKTK